MLLRDHLFYNGVRNWPPGWTWVDGQENKPPQGEIGILISVVPSMFLPANRCFLYIDYEGSSYMGCLLFDDIAFSRHITATITVLLRSVHCRNRQHRCLLHVEDFK